MPEYSVAAILEESVILTVEAENKEQAKEIVENLVNNEGGSDYSLPFRHQYRDFDVAVLKEVTYK